MDLSADIKELNSEGIICGFMNRYSTAKVEALINTRRESDFSSFLPLNVWISAKERGSRDRIT